MKTLILSVAAFLLALQSGCANGTNTNTISATNCGVRISCGMSPSNTTYVLGQRLTLTVSVQNINTSVVHFFETDPQLDLKFVVTNPNGVVLVPKINGSKKAEEFRRKLIALDSKKTYDTQICLSDLYDLKDAGKYTIVAKRELLLPDQKSCEALSDPFILTATSK